MSILLHQRLVASQTASVETIDLDRSIETAIRDLRRIERGVIWGKNPPGELTLRKLEVICSRLLQAVEARRLSVAIKQPV